MKSGYILRAITILTMCLALALVGVAQRRSKAQGRAFPPGPSVPCRQNTRVCVKEMNTQISQLRAYARGLKPGDKVAFNPQPDPPGDPAFRRANEAYRALQAEFSDLSGWSSETPNLKSRAAISDAQQKFGRLGQASDRASIYLALNSLSSSVQRLSRALGSTSSPATAIERDTTSSSIGATAIERDTGSSSSSASAIERHQQMKCMKNGAEVADATTRKTCKAAGGKWQKMTLTPGSGPEEEMK
jgi:hypothetical protein